MAAPDVVAAEDRAARRRASVPAITYPESLPITSRRDDLRAAIRDHQVVIVAGETGSGKSTQLPKLCLELGRGIDGMIGHTQPRRVAARTIAARVADELDVELGGVVGYGVRFDDRADDSTLVRVMTDGVLLAEIQRDRLLRRYDTLIVDEAHERSLNVDFLLGYLHRLLPRRPDLKLIVTSATIDTARFAAHFGDAPVVEVAGRTYPVEIRYRPFGRTSGAGDDDQRDQVQAVCDAVAELAAEGPGDVLVFLSGEREIHDTADALRRLQLAHTEVLPLYARLPSHEQLRIFEPHTGRRIVLATNVAETSLTVPGVRYVVDAGTARISRYSTRLKVQRLPIEPVSQASADQRAGRCGRVGPGICIRLYGEDNYAARPAFTEPEILRTNLAAVILQMTALGLGDVAAFPFLDPPDSRAVRDGVALLEELGALEPDRPADRRRLTALGRRLVRLPVDPRLGRMVLEAAHLGCAREVMVIAAALSIQDPRETPAAARQAATEMHARFRVDGSDLLALVRLWDHLRERQRELSSSQFRKLCRAEFLSYLRVREWQDLYRQLRRAATEVGVQAGGTEAHPDRVHQAVLSGLLSHIGMRDDARGGSRHPEMKGARGSRFSIAPGSVLAKRPPRWVMAAELVETDRLRARMVAAIQPEWAERLAPHLVSRSYGDPRWDPNRGAAVVTERVMLYGLPLVAGRQVGLDRIDPVGARELFIRHALVAGEWTTTHPFVAENAALLEEVAALGGRLRRADLLDDEVVFRFYDRRVGADVVSARHFDRWWKGARRATPGLLTVTVADLAGIAEAGVPLGTEYPDEWRQGALVLPVTYRFDPGDPYDGVTVHVPLAVLNQLRHDGFDWNVPGLREPLVEAMVRSLPKHLRRAVMPLAETVRAATRQIDPTRGSLAGELAVALTAIGGERIRPGDFDVDRVPAHLRVTFAIEDADGTIVAAGKDLAALVAATAGRQRAAISATTSGIERSGITTWDFGDLARSVQVERGGNVVVGFPALLDDGDSVSIRVFSTAAVQAAAMRAGTRRLLLLRFPNIARTLTRRLTSAQHLTIARAGTAEAALLGEIAGAAVDALLTANGGPAWDEAGHRALEQAVAGELQDRAEMVLADALALLSSAAAVEQRLATMTSTVLAASVSDASAHLRRLTRDGFVRRAGADRLADVVRYVDAIGRRLDKLVESPERDRRLMRDVVALEDRYRRLLAGLQRSAVTPEVVDLGWALEELRVQTFAQALGTRRPVSVQRIGRALDELAGR